MQVSIRVNPFNYLGKAFIRKSSYFQCFNSILYCPSAKFNLGLLIFIDVAVLLYRTCYFFYRK